MLNTLTNIINYLTCVHQDMWSSVNVQLSCSASDWKVFVFPAIIVGIISFITISVAQEEFEYAMLGLIGGAIITCVLTSLIFLLGLKISSFITLGIMSLYISHKLLSGDLIENIKYHIREWKQKRKDKKWNKIQRIEYMPKFYEIDKQEKLIQSKIRETDVYLEQANKEVEKLLKYEP